MGFARHEAGRRRREGWLVNVQSTSIEDDRVEGGGGRAAVDCYFLETDGATFKATIEYEPYFLVAARRGHEVEVEEWCKRVPAGGGLVKRITRVEKEDLQMPNHLLGYRRTFLELRFANVPGPDGRPAGHHARGRAQPEEHELPWTHTPKFPGEWPWPGRIGSVRACTGG